MSKEEVKTYTLEEIEEHSTSDSLWFVIDNEVYDVTKFQSEHPGGEEVLLDWAGKEATDAFEEAGHSTDARTLMKDYKIGELKEDDRSVKKKTNETSSCFCWKMILPVGVVVTAVLLYQVYSRMGK